MTTVMICDDDPNVREALAADLSREADLAVVATVETADEALRVLADDGTTGASAVDVVLMDLSMPGMNGIDATRAMRARHPGTCVMVLTAAGTEEQVRAALTAGAAGFLLKSTSPSALAAAVRAAQAEAGTVITPQLATRVIAEAPSASRGSSPVPADLHLTERESQVLSLLCAAESNAGIARALVLSESTVKSHVSTLMAKLDCTSRLQVALSAFERGIVDPPRPSI
jgi:DNA-binding NarL/FixJ family response regulator